MRLRVLLLLPVLFVASACQVFEPRQEPTETRDSKAVDDEVIRPIVSDPLNRAVEYLQNGEAEQAEGLLVEFLSGNPGNRMASLLLGQIRQDPAAFLGDRYEAIVVQPGDTLSQLAARHAGNGMLFFALARLNGIDRPRLLRPGTLLQVPVQGDGLIGPDDSPARAAGQLLDGGEAKEALAVLLAAAHGDEIDEEGLGLLIRSALAVSDLHLESGRIDQAQAVLEQIQPWANEAGGEDRLAHQYDRIDARRALENARSAAAANDKDAEHAWLRSATELDPELAAARVALEKATLERVEHYHERALQAWRDQDARTAAGHWERVLEIDPHFEPARVYLERAREILRRLEAL